MREKIFTVGPLILGFMLSAPKTIWFFNTGRSRRDMLLGVMRTYDRDIRAYAYSFYIGRLTFCFCWKH